MRADLKAFILAALNGRRGDDLLRAQKAFFGMSHEQMQKQHGDTGQTRAEVLAMLKAEDADITQAMNEVRAIPTTETQSTKESV